MRQKSNLKLRAFLLAFSIFLLSVGEILSPWNKEEAKNNEEEIRKHADLNNIRMYLLVCVHVCLYFVVTCSATPLLTENGPISVDEDIRIGFEAEKFLLDGAELMHHASAQTILYRKQGTLHMAIWDFHYLNQVDAKYFQGTDRAMVQGEVGNRKLLLYAGIGVFPQISITKFELGTNKKLQRYTKVFWYMGGSKN